MAMRCVRLDDNSKIVKLPINKAQRLVTQGKGHFVCKGIYRAWIKSKRNAGE